MITWLSNVTLTQEISREIQIATPSVPTIITFPLCNKTYPALFLRKLYLF